MDIHFIFAPFRFVCLFACTEAAKGPKGTDGGEYIGVVSREVYLFALCLRPHSSHVVRGVKCYQRFIELINQFVTQPSE